MNSGTDFSVSVGGEFVLIGFLMSFIEAPYLMGSVYVMPVTIHAVSIPIIYGPALRPKTPVTWSRRVVVVVLAHT